MPSVNIIFLLNVEVFKDAYDVLVWKDGGKQTSGKQTFSVYLWIVRAAELMQTIDEIFNSPELKRKSYSRIRRFRFGRQLPWPEQIFTHFLLNEC